jgi:hypothetical protein
MKNWKRNILTLIADWTDNSMLKYKYIKRSLNCEIKEKNTAFYWTRIGGIFSAIFIGHLMVLMGELIYYSKKDKMCNIKKMVAVKLVERRGENLWNVYKVAIINSFGIPNTWSVCRYVWQT